MPIDATRFIKGPQDPCATEVIIRTQPFQGKGMLVLSNEGPDRIYYNLGRTANTGSRPLKAGATEPIVPTGEDLHIIGFSASSVYSLIFIEDDGKSNFRRLLAFLSRNSGSGDEFSVVVMTRAASQSLVTSTITKIGLDTTSEDSGDGLVAVPGGNQILVVTPGYYLIIASLGFVANATGVRGVFLYKNGAGIKENMVVPPAVPFEPTPQIVAIVELAAGDTIELYGYQSSGAGLLITTTEYKTHLDVMLIGTV